MKEQRIGLFTSLATRGTIWAVSRISAVAVGVRMMMPPSTFSSSRVYRMAAS